MKINAHKMEEISKYIKSIPEQPTSFLTYILTGALVLLFICGIIWVTLEVTEVGIPKPITGSFIALVLVDACCLSAIFGYRQFMQILQIKRTPMSKIRSLATGYVEVQGLAKPFEKPLHLTDIHEELSFYSLELQQFVTKGKHSSWEEFHTITPTILMKIEDETGSVPLIVTSSVSCLVKVLKYDECSSELKNIISITAKEKNVKRMQLRAVIYYFPLNQHISAFAHAYRIEELVPYSTSTLTLVEKKTLFSTFDVSTGSEKAVLTAKYVAFVFFTIFAIITAIPAYILIMLVIRGAL